MRRYLFDTNILSALIKQPRGMLAEKIFALDREVFCTNTVVACEMRYGVVKKGSEKLRTNVSQLLENIDVLPLKAEVSDHYAALRNSLEKRGQAIGSNDIFIAAHAISLGLTLIIANEREFSRVPGLNIENWLVQHLYCYDE